MQFKYLYSFFKTFKIQGFFSVVSDFKGMVRYHFLYAAVESGYTLANNVTLFS